MYLLSIYHLLFIEDKEVINMEFYGKTRQNGKSVVVTIPQAMRIDVGTDVFVSIRQVKSKDVENVVKEM